MIHIAVVHACLGQRESSLFELRTVEIRMHYHVGVIIWVPHRRCDEHCLLGGEKAVGCMENGGRKLRLR
jgi:hypothetical protein